MEEIEACVGNKKWTRMKTYNRKKCTCRELSEVASMC